ncbi:hypothetical protein QBC42DRAFT_272974 [Cladorrhinum samala]|uniref:Zn(2)-C6 fungal-type domain-containing protein n=1 Tax=Cladorrhinum samala TaxID=585594 RepID=A0AAV9HH15_9PEZI|nr:hypothetical protein QBC42DRAFT_272974 [Cladorrhinum samala]
MTSSSSSKQPLRLLLPLTPQDPSSSSGGEQEGADGAALVPGLALPQTSTITPSNRRRVVARAACIPCRRRKTKCSAERPICNECLRRRSGDCCYNTTDEDETPGRALKRRYADLESQATTYEQVYDILRTRPQPEVEEVVRRIRSGENPSNIIRHVENGDLVLQPSVVPEARFRYEFPFRRTALPARLQTPENPYFGSLIHQWESRQETPSEARAGQQALASSEMRGLYLKPYHAAEVWDSLVDSAEPSKWTSVIKDNALLRNLLRIYFLHDYVWFTAFQKDYFLSDMIAGRRQFCSSLLVNAVLAIACHCDRSISDRVEFWNPHTLGYRFLNEARRLWEVEVASERTRLTTIQAAILLNYVYNMNSMVQLGWGYTLKAMDWARKIKLFDKPDGWETMDPRLRAGRDFTAWCLFEWQSHCTYFLFQQPLQDTPPEVPLPNVVHQPAWYGEVWLKYPLEQNLHPYHFAQFFKAKSGLRVILNYISRACFGRSSPNYTPPAENVWELYSRLCSWFADLPDSLLPKNIVLAGQLKLHMHYHHAVITLLQPLLKASTSNASPEPSTAPSQSANPPTATTNTSANPLSISAILNSDTDRAWTRSPSPPAASLPASPPSLPPIQAIISQARAHYESVLRLYYLRHGFEGFDPFLTVGLLTIFFLTLEEIKAARSKPSSTSTSHPSSPSSLASSYSARPETDIDSLRSTLVLCAKGLHDQGKSYFLAQTLFKLVRDAMDGQDKELLKEYVTLQEDDPRDEEAREQLMRGLWPLAASSTQSDRGAESPSRASEELPQESDSDERRRRGEDYWKKMDGMLRKYGNLKFDVEPGDDDDDDMMF